MRRIAAVALVLAAIAPAAAHAQLGELQPGVRVRLSAPGFVAEQYEGTLLARAGDTLVFVSPNFAQVRIPSSRITSLEISRGNSRMDGAKRGMMWGWPIGAVLGVIVAVAPEDDHCYEFCLRTGGERAAAAFFTVGVGAIYGAGIGALIGKEHWDRFDLGARTSLMIPAHRAGIGLAVAF